MIYLIIYLIGYITSYYILRRFKRKQLDKYYDWITVISQLLLALLSWFGVLIWMLMELFSLINKKLKKTKIPKWL